jgi:hypothetical protein
VFARLRRYLLTGGVDTVPALSTPVTVADAGPVRDAIARDSLRVVAETLAATAATPLRPEPLLLALAMCSATDDDLTRRAALTALPRVARTSRDLFLFASYVQGLRGWGRGLRRAIGAWYNERPLPKLVDEVLVTPSHAGWRHADLLRLGHPKASTPGHDALYRWLVTGSLPIDLVPSAEDAPALGRLNAWTRLQETTNGAEAAELIATYGLPMAAVPEALRVDATVWSAHVANLSVANVVLAIPDLVRAGTMADSDSVSSSIATRLTDDLGGVDPMALVAALRSLSETPEFTDLRTTLASRLVVAARRWARSAGTHVRLAIDPVVVDMPASADGIRPLDVAALLVLAGALAGWPDPVVAGDQLVPVSLPARPTLDEAYAAVIGACTKTRSARAGRGPILALADGPAVDGAGLTVEFVSRPPSGLQRQRHPSGIVVAGIDASAIRIASRLFTLPRDEPTVP